MVIPYAVDFKTGDVFRLMYGHRECDATNDETLNELKAAVEMAMNGSSERRETPEEPSTTKETLETPRQRTI